jgi:hypothetical protein
MNDYSVSAFMPEVKPAHVSEQSCVVRASSLGTAARLGFQTIRERDELRGKRITTVALTIRLIDGDAKRVGSPGLKKKQLAAA